MRVLALVGRAGSGKDTVCALLRRRVADARRFAFADALKDACADLLDTLCGVHAARDLFDDRDAKERPFENAVGEPVRLFECTTPASRTSILATPRLVAQRVGTDIMRRRLGTQVFSLAVVRRIRDSGTPLAIVTDARFPDEVDVLREELGAGNVVVMRIRRREVDALPITHETERAMELIATDVEINNDGTIEDLNAALTAQFFA